ncbi:hypothetical protein BVG79_00598 [Ketogulonicigenium robustum]|uniref:Uncharacterized protein n=1 Tax=Ketogulonicigenium robustum TaxID=92947 RepID=A0A1W6NXY4_9RHOB|nr:hypothetical protein BVG79_00598 [Ketogulonicigenium robustum]
MFQKKSGFTRSPSGGVIGCILNPASATQYFSFQSMCFI